MELPKDLSRVIDFHGHLCPGLLIGWRAAKIGLDRLRANRSEDEELVAIVENDSCSVDAVQVLAGATFGKGNLIFKDHGKQVFTFALRPSGDAVRVALRPEAFGKKSPGREDRKRQLMAMSDDELFNIEHIKIELPPEAEIRKSIICESCSEQVMETRTREVGGRVVCIPCSGKK